MLGTAVVFLLLTSNGTIGQIDGECLVEYRPGDAQVGEGITLSVMSEEEADSVLARIDDWASSQQRTAFVNVQGPGTVVAGTPLSTTVFVVSNRARQIRWKIEFIDHAGGGVNANWINEKLLFLQVWWGRIGSTDLILDVDSGTFLYEEDANYGRLLNPCQ